jgi:hypothetical protein
MAATRKTPGKRRVRSPDAGARKLRPTTKPTSVVDVARPLRAWTDSVLGIAGAAADATVAATKLLLPNPGNDAARDLSDEDFNAALNFARTAFDIAVAFRRDSHAGERSSDGG